MRTFARSAAALPSAFEQPAPCVAPALFVCDIWHMVAYCCSAISAHLYSPIKLILRTSCGTFTPHQQISPKQIKRHNTHFKRPRNKITFSLSFYLTGARAYEAPVGVVLLRYRLSSAAASPQMKLKLPGHELKSIVFTPFLEVPMNLQHL